MISNKSLISQPAVAAVAVLSLSCCLVQGKPYRGADDQDRSCEFDHACELYERCIDGWCRPAEECAACVDIPNGNAVCFHGECLIEACEDGFHDANGLYQDGCEYACTVTTGGVESCDETDNDCDGLTDEDFDLINDPAHCSQCGRACPVPDRAEAICAGGQCYYSCLEGWYDNDELPDNGCEADFCEPTAGGVEQCDMRDNNCDGEVDEGIVKDTVDSCGPLCLPCFFDHAESFCPEGRCVMGDCHADCYDLNASPLDGCEYCCVPTNGGVEVCDEVDNDCNGLTDEGLTCSCPDDMVLVESLFCIDRYEASRPDATGSSEGTLSDFAVSAAGVRPWTNTSLAIASAACQAAGKRLCTPAEWEQTCRGPDGTEYSYGDIYDPLTCNGIDTYCRCGAGSPCEDITPCPFEDCFRLGNCGADQRISPTGSFPDCTNAFGVFDINGNVWERVQGGTGRGGAYNCINSKMLHRCDYIADWGTVNIANFGFRCCCTQCPD